MTTILGEGRIASLNTEARRLIDEMAMDAYDAYQEVAEVSGLSYVRSTHDAGDGGGPQCEIWRDADGSLVNLWIVGDSADLLGFDDQIDD